MARKDQEEWIPNDHHIFHPAARSSARPSRRGQIKMEPSILEMLDEEETAVALGLPGYSPHIKTEDAPTRKRKKESKSDAADNKKRRLKPKTPILPYKKRIYGRTQKTNF